MMKDAGTTISKSIMTNHAYEEEDESHNYIVWNDSDDDDDDDDVDDDEDDDDDDDDDNEIDLDQPVFSHPYLEGIYPGLAMPLTLREVRTLEDAQKILRGTTDDPSSGEEEEEETSSHDFFDTGALAEVKDLEVDLDQPTVACHPYLEERYPSSLVMPITVRQVHILEWAQQILFGVPGAMDPEWDIHENGRIGFFSCDGRRLNDDVAIMDNICSLTVVGPTGTLPVKLVPKYMPELQYLNLWNMVPSPEEREGGNVDDGFSFPKDIVEQLNVEDIFIDKATRNIIHQLYPLQKLDSLEIGGVYNNGRIVDTNSLPELIAIFEEEPRSDDDSSDGNSCPTRSEMTPLNRTVRCISVAVSSVSVEHFCDFVLLFTPDKYPKLENLSITEGVIRAEHVEGLARRLTNLIDEQQQNNKSMFYQPLKLKKLPFGWSNECFFTIAGLRSIISLLDVLDTVDTMYFPDDHLTRQSNSKPDERFQPDYKRLFRHIMFRLNYNHSRFTEVVPIGAKSFSKMKKQCQQRKAKDGDDHHCREKEVETASSTPLSLWPRLIHRAGFFRPKYLLGGEWMCSVTPITPPREKDLAEIHASTIFFLLKNELCTNYNNGLAA